MDSIISQYREVLADTRRCLEALQDEGVRRLKLDPELLARLGNLSSDLSPEEKAALLAELEAEVSGCEKCRLCEGRTQTVFGVGNPDADLMFIGEAPGADEDRQGEPFVGRAGQLLTKIIQAMGMERDQVYIGNVLKCRPPGNRNPQLDEKGSCEPYLIQQIGIIRPKVIVALGNIAVQSLLLTSTGITKLRGRFQEYQGIPLMPTFHPAALLRNPSQKKLVWEDMKTVMAFLKENQDS